LALSRPKQGFDSPRERQQLCFCTLHTNEILRTNPLVQVDYVCVVDLDIGASKSDICAVIAGSDRATLLRSMGEAFDHTAFRNAATCALVEHTRHVVS
jgi:hypothetical protein